MSDWYYRKQGMFDETTEGPLSDAEFLRLAYDGKLKLDTLVTSQQHTKGQWVKVGQIPAARNKLDEGVEARRQAKERLVAEAAQQKEEKRAKAAELKQQRLTAKEAERAKAEELQQQAAAVVPSSQFKAVPSSTESLPENAIVGKIIESRPKKAGPVAKALSGFFFLFLCIYYLVAILLCFTCIGIIIAFFMITGVAAFQAALLYVLTDGTVYVAECPCCKRRIEGLFLPEKQPELSQPCPTCKKLLIVRDGVVFHVP